MPNTVWETKRRSTDTSRRRAVSGRLDDLSVSDSSSSFSCPPHLRLYDRPICTPRVSAPCLTTRYHVSQSYAGRKRHTIYLRPPWPLCGVVRIAQCGGSALKGLEGETQARRLHDESCCLRDRLRKPRHDQALIEVRSPSPGTSLVIARLSLQFAVAAMWNSAGRHRQQTEIFIPSYETREDCTRS